jgi:anti-anti-sigma factor
MKMEVRKIGTVDIFTPVGPLADQDAEAFSKALLSRLSSEAGNARIGVAMQEVPYMDSQALGALLTATETLGERATCLKLAGVTPTCREIFELTGLSSRFRFFKDVEDIVKSFLT